MCVDFFMDLNVACSKDSYPLPYIDHLIDGSLGYRMLSFMDQYSGYKHIQMDPIDVANTVFMTNTKMPHPSASRTLVPPTIASRVLSLFSR